MGTILHGGDVYLITEYMEGGTLWKLLSAKAKPLPWLTRVNISIDVARAITYLHARNIIHRDLKCRNLLIDRNIRVKVCDFGLCRETNPEQQKFMTKSGTDEWMAPEVILGNPYNAKADSFSFGMVLFEILTREKPPPRDPMRGFELDPNEISAALPTDCPPDLRQLTLDCIQSDQNARPGFKDIMDRLFKLRDRLKPPKKAKEGDSSTLPANFMVHSYQPDILPPPEAMVLPPMTPRTEAQLMATSTMPPPPADAGASSKRPATGAPKRVFKKTVTEVPADGGPVPPGSPTLAPLLDTIPPPTAAAEASEPASDKMSKKDRRKSTKLLQSEIQAAELPPPPMASGPGASLSLPPPPLPDEKEHKPKRKSEKRPKKELDRAVSPPPNHPAPPPLAAPPPALAGPSALAPPPALSTATPPSPAAAVIPKLPSSMANVPVLQSSRGTSSTAAAGLPPPPTSLLPPPL